MPSKKQRRQAADGTATPHFALGTPHSGRPVIGLAGGIASGKTFVAQQFAGLGCAVVDADRMGHELLEKPEVRQALRRRFGKEIFDPSGQVNRQQLGAVAFSSRERLETLNSIVHKDLWPKVVQAVQAACRRDVPAVVLDAALILEKGLDKLCTVVLYIEAPEEVRRIRARQQRGWEPAEVTRREAVQVSLKAKRERADYIIDNSRSPEHTLEQIRRILSCIAKS